jgi:hypothetical protein
MVVPDMPPDSPQEEPQLPVPGLEEDRPEGLEQDLGEKAARIAEVRLAQSGESDEDNPRAKYYMGPGRETNTTEPPRVRAPKHTPVNRRGGRSYEEPGGRDVGGIEDRAEYARQKAAGEIKSRTLFPQPEMQAALGVVARHWRAKFIPKTGSELKETRAILEHIGNPMNRKGGVHDHFRKLADGEKARIARTGGNASEQGRAVRSRLFEYTDYLSSAQRSVVALRGLKQILDTQTDPTLTLADLAQSEPDINGLDDLIQYMDGLDVLTKGGSFVPFKQWVARRNENPQLLAAGQNKRLEDAYSGSGQTEEERAYIDERLSEIRVLNVMSTTRDAIENARLEENFWGSVIDDAGYEFSHTRDEVVAATEARTS